MLLPYALEGFTSRKFFSVRENEPIDAANCKILCFLLSSLFLLLTHHTRPPTFVPTADADIRERFIRDGGSLMPVYAVAFLVILALYLTFALGGFPSTTDREITFTFLKSEIRIGTMSIWTRFMCVHQGWPRRRAMTPHQHQR